MSTTVGESPSDGSSSSSTSGAATSARRDRELLLLAARERAGGPAPELLHDREQLVDGGDVRLGALAAPAAREPELEVLLDAELGEDAASLGDERDAALGDVLGRAAAERRARRAGSPLPAPGRAP